MKMNLVFLPATEPSDTTYGTAPCAIGNESNVSLYAVKFPRLVWYNEKIQRDAIAQITALGVGSLILVGFSKSGLGAWNIAKAIPDIVSATIIFDAPMMRKALPPWGTAPYYSDDASWLKDLPARTVHEFKSAMPRTHRLILISGMNFHDEMDQFSDELHRVGLRHSFFACPKMSHRWDSGWLEMALTKIVEQGAQPDAFGAG